MRRSTTGGAILHGSCIVAHWSRSQARVALSGAGAQLKASAQAACDVRS